MAAKEKRATEKLNVALAGIESALTVMLSGTTEDTMNYRVIKGGLERCEEARDALLTIQFHTAQI